MDGCGAGGGAGALELGVRGVGSIARGERWGGGGCGAGGGRTRRNNRGRQQQIVRGVVVNVLVTEVSEVCFAG